MTVKCGFCQYILNNLYIKKNTINKEFFYRLAFSAQNYKKLLNQYIQSETYINKMLFMLFMSLIQLIRMLIH